MLGTCPVLAFYAFDLIIYIILVVNVVCVFLTSLTTVIACTRSPSVSRIRAKMLYAMTKARFRREIDGIHYEIQATDPSEMELEVLRERAN